MDESAIIRRTRHWLERAVIGLNLCPFARAPYVQQRVRFRVSCAHDATGLLIDLEAELLALHAAEPQDCETTLLIHPAALLDFAAFNDFLDEAEACIERLDLLGDIQLASFHPNYQFAGSAPEEIENFTNRSPYPMLHLLREASIARVVDAQADTDGIVERNQTTLRELGVQGWQDLWQEDGAAAEGRLEA